MKTCSGSTINLTAIALCGVVLISGCTSSGQGYTDEATQVTQRPYANVNIRQMGRVTLGNQEFAQASVRNALDALTKAGVPEEALISASVNGIGAPGRSSGGGRFTSHEVWVTVAECPTRVFFRARASGIIFEMHDEADCVALAKAAVTSPS